MLGSLGTLAPDRLRLTDAHMRAMFAAIDVDESGTVDWCVAWVACAGLVTARPLL